MDTLARRIASRREELNLGPADLASIAGISIQAVLKWESGATSNLKHENLFLLADALNVHPRWLALGEGPKIASPSREAYRAALARRDVAGDDRARLAWERIAASFAKAAALAFFALMPLLAPSPADAGPLHVLKFPVCVLCQIRKWLSQLGAARKFCDAQIAMFLVRDIFLIPRVSFPTAR